MISLTANNKNTMYCRMQAGLSSEGAGAFVYSYVSIVSGQNIEGSL